MNVTMGFGFFESVFPVLFGLTFVVILGVFVAALARGLLTWNRNNRSPVLTVEAILAGKRIQVSGHRHAAGNEAGFSHTGTSYFLTFQVESGDRLEFQVDGGEYGQLMEGDRGRLTLQGTRYQGFQRV